MSLHKVVEFLKKFGIGIGIGIVLIIVISILIRIGSFVISIVSPPKITPPNQAFDVLPAIQFPENKLDNAFTYQLDTASGTLPTDFPDRLVVYSLVEDEPNFLNLDKAKVKAQALNFTNETGRVTPEVNLGNGNYEWTDSKSLTRKLKISTVSFDFSLTSNYLASITVLTGTNLSNESEAIETTKTFLDRIELLPDDVDFKITETDQKEASYNTYPKVYAIVNGALIPASSLSSAKVIRVDLYQKNVEYQMDTGKPKAAKLDIKLPIRYPDPPFSTMSFWIGSGETRQEVYAVEFIHKKIAKSDNLATYPIKTSEEAFKELEDGNAYIASYQGLEQQIFIKDIYLAYYIGRNPQAYLMPIYVFEGQDGFFAYVSAVKSESIK